MPVARNGPSDSGNAVGGRERHSEFAAVAAGIGNAIGIEHGRSDVDVSASLGGRRMKWYEHEQESE